MATRQLAYIDFAAGEIKELASGDITDPVSLGTGTPDNTKFLRGDGSWQTQVQRN